MASITIHLQNVGGSPATMTVDEDQDLSVPRLVDESGTKRAGDLVVGEYLNRAGVVYTVVADPEE